MRLVFFLLLASVVNADPCPRPVADAVASPLIIVATYDATLSWTPPTTNEDGTPLDDLGGYSIYIGPSAGSLSFFADVADPLATQTVISGLSAGEKFFGATAWDDKIPRNESVMSNVISKVLGP